jgi:hypothetical protein
MSDIPLDRQVLIVSWYGLRDLDGLQELTSRYKSGAELAEKTP